MKNKILKQFFIVILFVKVLMLSSCNNVNIIPEMIPVKGGVFLMGDTRNDSQAKELEKPFHAVILSYDYYIGKYEVTFDEYDAYCEATGDSKPDDEGWGRGSRPVINVSWWDAIAYCNWLSEQEGLKPAYDDMGELIDKTGNKTTDLTEVEGYRLPTEAEWEYAAKGGGKSTGNYKYAGSDTPKEVAWYDFNSNEKTHEVGGKKPNELGIYDMSGNVWEYCYDWYGDYLDDLQENPVGDEIVAWRGGGWRSSCVTGGCRITLRTSWNPNGAANILGIRIVKTNMEEINYEIDPELGYAYYRTGFYKKSIAAYLKAIKIDPEDAIAYFYLGQNYFRLEHYERAIAEYLKAIELNPEFATAYYSLGDSYIKTQRQDRYDKAISAYLKVIELDPQDAWSYYMLGQIYYLKKNNLTVAKKMLDQLEYLDDELYLDLYKILKQ